MKKIKEKKEKNKGIFWDYDVSKINLKNPKIKKWYLSRKLRFGDLKGLKKSELKKHLPGLNIDRSLKELLRNYLKNAKS